MAHPSGFPRGSASQGSGNGEPVTSGPRRLLRFCNPRNLYPTRSRLSNHEIQIGRLFP